MSLPLLRSRFELVAYRGGAGERPENTIEAFRYALSLSPDIILDLDLQESKDSEIVVIHDPTLERTTDGNGRVADHTLAELKALDAAFRFVDESGRPVHRGRGIRISTLEEVLETFPDARFIVDIRRDDSDHIERVLGIVERMSAAERVFMVSESDEVVDRCRAVHPEWTYGAPTGEARAVIFGSEPPVSPVFMVPETHEGIQVVTVGMLERLHAHGRKVWVWTIDDPNDVYRLRRMGVDGVFTNCPGQIAGGWI